VDSEWLETSTEDEGCELLAAEGDEARQDVVEVRVVAVGEETDDVDERTLCVELWLFCVASQHGVCVRQESGICHLK